MGLKVDVKLGRNKDDQMFELEKALKVFKKKLDKDNILREYRDRRYYTKPSVLKREQAKKARKNRI